MMFMIKQDRDEMQCDMHDYSIESVLKEIECDISYLEDAPDEQLAPYDDRFDSIRERLQKLEEYLHNINITIT